MQQLLVHFVPFKLHYKMEFVLHVLLTASTVLIPQLVCTVQLVMVWLVILVLHVPIIVLTVHPARHALLVITLSI